MYTDIIEVLLEKPIIALYFRMRFSAGESHVLAEHITNKEAHGL